MTSTPGGGGGSKSGSSKRGGGSNATINQEDTPSMVDTHDYFPNVETGVFDVAKHESFALAKEALIKMTGLTPQEVERGMKGIIDFTGSYSDAIRKSEQNGKPNGKAQDINNLLQKMPKYDGAVYRGLSLDEKGFQAFLATNKAGGKMSLNAMSSFTTDTGVAKRYSSGNDHGVLLAVQNRSGVSIKNLSKYKGEDEVLVPRGTKYTILDVTTFGNRTVVRLVED